MYGWDNNIYLTMIPATGEIAEYDGDNLYYCGLERTRQSIVAMVEAAEEEFHAGRDLSDPHWASPRFGSIRDRASEGVYGNFPEVLFNLVISLSASGMGVGVYKLIDLWVKAKNGRKIHAKLPDGLVLDVTQMTHKDFSELLSEIYKVYNEYGDPKSLKKHVKSKRLKEVSADETRELQAQIGKAVMSKGDQIAKRRRLK